MTLGDTIDLTQSPYVGGATANSPCDLSLGPSPYASCYPANTIIYDSSQDPTIAAQQTQARAELAKELGDSSSMSIIIGILVVGVAVVALRI